ncbi:DUF1152 domain-containing protein [Kitasatospora purpeofusca]|uniref:DUF1152 domain-containing protein n=1 Tax=Kitasatospora purpeofusca TaxID=67352 RepID=UPI00224EE54F|nr:DUF1152 domain-containing protein [Kitasatospora purpeofusca]MCX4752381.1 DUF1152 domain-containing protein [Kitasatospora purpeofusca]WSR31957.1 DUF1152 domain-containing protein [Kitasatospora purpeofusca]
MTSLLQPPLITRLLAADRILIAGAGGGFDVYAGLPLALALRAAGKEVHLANLSFSELHALPAEVWQEPDLALITPDTPAPEGYFPERTLARWLRLQGMPDQVWAFPRTGVRPLRAAYRSLVDHLGIDAVLLVDGGTDILMRGDEVGLGTPEEDMTSLAAVAGLTGVPERLVACLGFGIDAHHGVNHSLVLENLAAIDRAGGYLGAFSVPRDSREGTLYLDAVEHARAAFPEHPSIVQGSVAAALRGLFGDVRFTDRTKGGKLFVNPLMTLYFGVTVEALVAEHRYLDRLERTVLMRQVATVISEFQDSLPVQRPPRQFPH